MEPKPYHQRLQEEAEEEEQLIWKSDSPESMVSVTVGRATATLLAARSRKLLDSVSRFAPGSTKRPSLGSLEDSLWFLHKFVRDAAETGEKMDQILVPIIEHGLRGKDSTRVGQAVILLDWLFRDELVFEAAAKNLAEILERKDDRYLALGWCVLVRSLVEYESLENQSSLIGLKERYSAFLKIFCSCVPQLSVIACNTSTVLDGFELPSRLAVCAADCILAISEALTKKTKVNKPKSLISNASDEPISVVPAVIRDKTAKSTQKLSEVSNVEMACLLWDLIDQLVTLLQRLVAWSRKSRPLHARGVEQVLIWLQEIKGQYGHVQDEAGANVVTTEPLLLSSCWKHYSILLRLEDHRFSQHCNEWLGQYVSGIQYYTDNNTEGIGEKDGSVETRKFFLNCLCLLLGRFDKKKFENMFSEYGMQFTHVLLSQLHCADEDVIAGAVCIFKAAIFRPGYASGNGLADSTQMDAVLPLLLNLLDERDGTAKAVVVLVAEYCSMSTDSYCLKQVLQRLQSGNALQRRNAIDVLSELVCISSDSASAHFAWQEMADSLLECLRDEEIVIREQASKLLSVIDPSLVLPALVHLLYSSNDVVQSSASSAFIAILKKNNQKPEVICMLLDCLSNLSLSEDSSETTGVSNGTKVDTDQVLKLIPQWAKSVQDWDTLIVPVIDKLFAEPANATIVRFLSYISEHLAEAAALVLNHVLSQMKGQQEIDENVFAKLESRAYTSQDSANIQQCLFERLCPLLIIRLLPLKVFDDLHSSVMYGQLHNESTKLAYQDIAIIEQDCVVAILLKRAFGKSEFEDVRKLAAELCGRIHPQVLFPIVSSLLDHAAAAHNILKIKACLFSVCTSLVVRQKDSVSHPAIPKIRKTLEAILLWPSLDEDEVSKAQHGCIDCLALMICAELEGLRSEKFSIVGKTGDSGNSILMFVIDHLINDKNLVASSLVLNSENCGVELPFPIPFRLCMANVLISAAQKISDYGKKPFARKTLPRLISSVEVIMHPEIRAACIQIMFSAVYHLRSAVLPYSSDLLKLSLDFLQKVSDKERIGGAKLMASLMASEDAILQSISGGLIEASSVLSRITLSDPSPDVRQVCRKLLECMTTP